MDKLKASLVAGISIAIGLMTFQMVRRRRNDPRQEAEDAAGEALREAGEAAEHATAAFDHARLAGRKTVEYARQEFDGVAPRQAIEGNGAQEMAGEQSGRLRNVGKGWLRQ